MSDTALAVAQPPAVEVLPPAPEPEPLTSWVAAEINTNGHHSLTAMATLGQTVGHAPVILWGLNRIKGTDEMGRAFAERVRTALATAENQAVVGHNRAMRRPGP
jgi:hypothetical protein